MDVLAIGAVRMRGTSDKGPYDFAEIRFLSEIKPRKTARFELQGYGYEARTDQQGRARDKIMCSPEVVEKMKGFSFPCWVECKTDTVMGFNGPEPFVVDVKPAKPAMAAVG